MPLSSAAPSSAGRAAPPGELAAFLTELAVALQNHGVYPPGHPFLSRSAAGVVRRLDALLGDRPSLSFGVARRQLVIEGVATDAGNPALSGLAGRLHRHRVGAVTLARGLDAGEASSVLCFLAREGEAGRPPVSEEAWPHARLHALSYAQLELTGDGASAPPRDAARAAQLWMGLARAALTPGSADRRTRCLPESDEKRTEVDRDDAVPSMSSSGQDDAVGSLAPDGSAAPPAIDDSIRSPASADCVAVVESAASIGSAGSTESPGQEGSAASVESTGFGGSAVRAMAGDADESADAATVATAIDRSRDDCAYDQAIVGYLLQLAEELRADAGPGAVEVRRRMSELVQRLSPATLARLVEMGGDAAQRRRFLLDASHGFAAEAVVRLVEAAAEANGQTLSSPLVRLLNKLAAHAADTPGAAGAADSALREQVERLVAGWALPDPNPVPYTQALDRLSRNVAGPTGLVPGPNAPEPERILETALEVGANGPTVWIAIEVMERGGALHRVVERTAATPSVSELADAVWAYAGEPAAVRRLVRAGAEAARALDAVIARVGEGAAAPLLDELADSPIRAVRRAAIDRLVALGVSALPEIGRRLGDPRWYVVRNLLGIVAEIGAAPDGFSASDFLRHGDPRVRREAFKAAFRLGGERVRAIGLALTDGDPQVQRLALSECAADCPAPALPLVCRRIDDPSTDPELRAMAVRVLGASRDPRALQTLTRLTTAGRTLLGRVRLAPRSPESLAALGALRVGWFAHPVAASVLEAARRAPDPDIRRAVAESAGR